MNKYLRASLLSSLVALMAGCMVNGHLITDQPPRNGFDPNVQTSAPKTVELSKPVAHYHDNALTVSGTARKVGDSNETISGFIDVQILDQNKNVIDETLAKLSPETLTAQPSSYRISVWNHHPADANVRVVFVDRRDAAAFYGDTTNASGGSGMPTTSGNFSRGGGESYGGGSAGFGRGINGVQSGFGPMGVGGVSTVGAWR